jgi:pimeloyl-ACP methyl ester carboxylesterase
MTTEDTATPFPTDGQNPARRQFLTAAALAAAAPIAGCAGAPASPASDASDVRGTAHYAIKQTSDGPVRLFLWRKVAAGGGSRGSGPLGTVVFVHGSSVQSQPAFDLQIPGRSEVSVMDAFARRGFDTWCFDCEGYGRSDKKRPINADIAEGARDVAAAVEEIVRITGRSQVLLYGSSSGALRAGLYAQQRPERVKRLTLDALVWTGEGSPTLAERRKRVAQFRAANRRPIDRAFVRSIFTRDHPGTSDLTVVEAFADQVLALDDSMPTGTYLDMSANLPVIDPRQIRVPTLVMRGQWDGIASLEDVNRFFLALPNPDKQLIVMPGVAHTSLRSKNYKLVHHFLASFLSQPDPVYVG